jgi:hypothetical protein
MSTPISIRTGKPINGEPPYIPGDILLTDEARHVCIEGTTARHPEWVAHCLKCRTRATVKAAVPPAHTCQTCLDAEAVRVERLRERRERSAQLKRERNAQPIREQLTCQPLLHERVGKGAPVDEPPKQPTPPEADAERPIRRRRRRTLPPEERT